MLKEFFVGDFHISKTYVRALAPRVALLMHTYLSHCLTRCSTGVLYKGETTMHRLLVEILKMQIIIKLY